MSAGGLLAQMFLGGSAEAAGGIGERLRLEAAEARKAKMLDQERDMRLGIADKEHDYRMEEQEAGKVTWKDERDAKGNLLGQRSSTGQFVPHEKKEPKNELPANTKAFIDSRNSHLTGLHKAYGDAVTAGDREGAGLIWQEISKTQGEIDAALGRSRPEPKPQGFNWDGAVESVMQQKGVSREEADAMLRADSRYKKYAPALPEKPAPKDPAPEPKPAVEEPKPAGILSSATNEPVYTNPFAERDAQRVKDDEARLNAAREKAKNDPQRRIKDATADAEIAARKFTVNGKLNQRGMDQAMREIIADYDLTEEEARQVLQSVTR